MGIRIIRCALIMGGKHVFHILHGQLFLRHQAPWNIIRLWAILGIYPIPSKGMWIQAALNVPCARRIINMIGIRMASKCIARAKDTFLI